jgi:hypothetical protein
MAYFSKEEELAGETPDDHNGKDSDSSSNKAVESAAPVAFEHFPTSKSRRHGLFGVTKGSRAQPHGMWSNSFWTSHWMLKYCSV